MKVWKWICVSVYESMDMNMGTRSKEYKFICICGINEMYGNGLVWLLREEVLIVWKKKEVVLLTKEEGRTLGGTRAKWFWVQFDK